MSIDSPQAIGRYRTRERRREWLETMLRRNAGCRYLRNFGSPRTEAEYVRQVPITSYEDLSPYITDLENCDSNVLFDGSPVAFERTGGSCGGSKLIPYSRDGLHDFQRILSPWLRRTIERYQISGAVYFSTSPVARTPESIGGLSVGLSDDAYLGKEAGMWLQEKSVVPASVAETSDIEAWRQRTLDHLKAAGNLELISVWSPTFLLRLLDGISNTEGYWPNLKVISCWASGSARRHLEKVIRLFPQAIIEPKGLLSTEGIITVPDADGNPRLARHGYFEFRQQGQRHAASELSVGGEYEVILTTASGLYRYASGDRVRCEQSCVQGDPILEFIGRDSMTSDLVGEKLTEAFVSKCLNGFSGFAMLVPCFEPAGYVLVCDSSPTTEHIQEFENRLRLNPQYNYARRLGQLGPVSLLTCRNPHEVVEQVMYKRGTRLGDIKPTSLRSEEFWLPLFKERLS